MDPPRPDGPSEDKLPVLPEDFEGIRLLGEGAVSRVYLAREPALGRVVAVKVLRSEMAADETARRRFEREAKSAASLTHPNVVPYIGSAA
jgi:serine/threonine-protein kinase